MSDVFEMVAADQPLLLPEETGFTVAIGAGARDLHLKDIVWPQYQPGKTTFAPADYQRLKELTPYEYEEHLGGNMLNTATALAAWGHDIGFVSVLSHPENPDPTSNLIRAHLGRYGITDRTRQRHNYQVSTSVIMYKGDDQQSRGIPRDSMYEPLDTDYLRQSMHDAKTVAFASLKDPNLNRRVLALAAELPEDTFISANFGSSEFRDHPKELLGALEIRRPDLLALNETEASQLLSRKNRDAEELTAQISQEFARFVLTTCGKDGVLLGHKGEIVHAPAIPVEAGTPIFTLGAGDRAHALALSGLTRGLPWEKIPAVVALGTLPVIQTLGAHGDLAPNASPLVTRRLGARS